jgi:hypothetical protein
MKPKIPKEKILGLRYGQLLVGVIDKLIDHREILRAETLVDKLFCIGNSDLQKAIDEFLKEYEAKE